MRSKEVRWYGAGRHIATPQKGVSEQLKDLHCPLRQPLDVSVTLDRLESARCPAPSHARRIPDLNRDPESKGGLPNARAETHRGDREDRDHREHSWDGRGR